MDFSSFIHGPHQWSAASRYETSPVHDLPALQEHAKLARRDWIVRAYEASRSGERGLGGELRLLVVTGIET